MSVPPPRAAAPSTSPSSSSSPSSPSSSANPPYPPLHPTGSLLLAYQLPPLSHPSRPALVVLIGGGAVAASRLFHLLCAAPARIRLIAPEEGVCDETLYRIHQAAGEEPGMPAGCQTEIEWIKREYLDESDLDGATMVLTAIDSPAVSSSICQSARRLKIPVNVADVPSECDFYFGSVLRRGALSVMVSTNGKGPRVAARIRRRLEKALPGSVGVGIERVGELRKELRKVESGKGTAAIERRMEWMSRVSDRWSLAQLGEMDDRMLREVLEGWEAGEARGYWDVNRSSYLGLGRVLSWASRAGLDRCPVDRDPDGRASRCPFLLTSAGFVLGAVTGVAATLAVGWARRR